MAQRLSAVLPSVLLHAQQAHGTLWTIQRRWKTFVGPGLAAHTRPVSLRKGRLTIHADRPGDTFALHYARAVLLARLQAATDGKVAELFVRPGEAAGAASSPRRASGTTHGVSH